jgi:hypothetical protein
MNDVVFTRTRQGVFDPDTGDFGAPVVSTIGGEGILMSGDPVQYAALGLILETTPVVGFTPTDYPLPAFTPDFLLPGDTTPINGVVFTVVKLLKVVAPDGFVVYSRIAVTA